MTEINDVPVVARGVALVRHAPCRGPTLEIQT